MEQVDHRYHYLLPAIIVKLSIPLVWRLIGLSRSLDKELHRVLHPNTYHLLKHIYIASERLQRQWSNSVISIPLNIPK